MLPATINIADIVKGFQNTIFFGTAMVTNAMQRYFCDGEVKVENATNTSFQVVINSSQWAKSQYTRRFKFTHCPTNHNCHKITNVEEIHCIA